MKLTVLIDLDDTLLSNNMDTFLKVYLKGLGAALSPFVVPEKMVSQLLMATGMMTAKKTPALTLEETFDQNFYPPLGFKKEDLEPALLEFYDKEFPKFRSVTGRREVAVNLIKNMVNKDWDVIIATNPLFPQTAVVQRALWAGLADHLPAIKSITSFENYHFAKPNPAYYAEILGHIGCPNQPAVMIGNSLSDDILPAAGLGLPVYWLNDGKGTLPINLDGRGQCGSLDGVFDWLESIAAKGKLPETVDPQGLLAILAATPASMDFLCRPLDDGKWKTRPAENEWSPTEVLCHMRDVDEEINLPRLPIFLSEKNPFLAAVDSDSWAKERSYQLQDGSEALLAFLKKRTELVIFLEKLSENEWNLPARHAIFGPITLKELIGFIVSHDRVHLNQMVSTLNSI